MMEDNDLIMVLMRRLAKAEEELAALRHSIRGNFPDLKDGVSVEDRLAALEQAPTTQPDIPQLPIVVSGASGEGVVPLPEQAVVETEWGIPTADPGDAATATITLQPCDEDGVSYANADTATVYIREDRAAAQLGPRGWLATAGEVTGTILSFMRFPWDVGSAPAVVGVLVGEGEPDKVRASVADTTPGYFRFTAGDQQAHHKLIGDSETDACSAATGYWLQATIINAGADEQLKIEHVGPGPLCYCWDSCGGTCEYVTGVELDATGHVRKLGTSDSCWFGPCV